MPPLVGIHTGVQACIRDSIPPVALLHKGKRCQTAPGALLLRERGNFLPRMTSKATVGKPMKHRPKKKTALAFFSLTMGIPFGTFFYGTVESLLQALHWE